MNKRLTEHDRAEIERFTDYLRRVGRPVRNRDEPGYAEYGARLRAWIAEDPEGRRAYLGLPPVPRVREDEQE